MLTKGKKLANVTLEFDYIGNIWEGRLGDKYKNDIEEIFVSAYGFYVEKFNKRIGEINEKWSILRPDLDKGIELGSNDDIQYCHFVCAELFEEINRLNMEVFGDTFSEYRGFYIDLNPDNMAFRLRYWLGDNYCEIRYKAIKIERD